ncbi:MAG: Bug family tripartite tricarboxylate transporter substrate binding protein [Spirochaetota bacterium]
MMKRANVVLMLLVLLLLIPGGLFAAGQQEMGESPEQFYEGNRMTMIIPMSAGGGFDTFGRILAKYIEKHMDVRVNVENVPGGGGVIGMNQLYVSDSDGLTLGYVAGTTAILGGIRGLEGINFELSEYEFLGRHNAEPKAMYVRSGSGYEDFYDVMEADKLKIGTSGTGSGDHQAQSVITKLFDVNANVITGYGGTSELYLALARGEIDLTQGSGSGALGTVQSGDIRPVLVYTEGGVPDYFAEYEPTLISDVPSTDHEKEVVEALTGLYALERVFAFPPDTDKALVDYVRDVFADIAEDEDFLADCERSNVSIQWASGERIEEIAKQMTEGAEILRPYLDL